MYNASVAWTTSTQTNCAYFVDIKDAVKIYEAFVARMTYGVDKYFTFNCDSGMYTVRMDNLNSISMHTKEEMKASYHYMDPQ